MNKYEIMYIVAGDVAENIREEQIAKIEALVISEGGVVENIDKQGMKKFAYPIDYKNEGYYVIMNFTSKAEFVAELERRMKLNENIVRQMVIRKDA